MKRLRIVLFIYAFQFCILNLKAQVGVGTTNPEAMLHINGSARLEHNSATNGKVLYVEPDGSILWSRAYNLQLITSSLPNNGVNLDSGATPKFTNASITLPKGKYLVKGIILLQGNFTYNEKESTWVTMYLSDSNSNSSITTDVIQNSAQQMSGGIVGPANYSILEGSIAIENTSTTPKTYYFWAYSTNYGKTHSKYIVDFTGQNWGENVVYALLFE